MEKLVGNIPPSPVAAKYTASCGAEAQKEGNESTKGEPVGIAVLGRGACVAVARSCNAEEDHVDDPGNEGHEESEAREKSH